MAKLSISDSDRLQLIGLLSVGAQLLQQLNTVDQAMCKLLDVTPDYSGYSAHINDTLYEADTHSPIRLADTLLHQLHIEVVPDATPAPVAEEPEEPLGGLTITGSPLENLTVRIITDKSAPSREEPPF